MEIFENQIVIGGGHHNTLGVVRALGERGYGVELITIGSAKERYVSKSRYVKKHHALVNVKELASYLLYREKPQGKNKEIVFSCSDEVTEHLNDNRNRLTERYILPGHDEQGKMVELMDKTTMISMAGKRGLIAPIVWRLPQERNSVTYPCITKAHVSSHGGKGDVRIIHGESELEKFLDGCNDEVFAQSFIPKKEEVQFIGCSLRGGEEVIIPGMTHILRSQPNTNTGFLEYGTIDEFWEETVKKSKLFIRDCGYSGLFSIEFLRTNDDEVRFLEINFRNDGNAWCVTSAGVNLPVVWVKANKGEDYSMELHEVKKIIVMPEFQDFKLVLQRKLSFGKWLRDVRRTDAFLDWNKKDMKPFFGFLLNKIV